METLLEQANPHGTVRAVVESDGRVMYLYLWGHPSTDFGMRAVWLRNLDPAPAELDMDAMKAGEPPLMPAKHCQQTKRQEPPSELDLRVVWLPEGNGVALYEDRRLWAVIPPWSGQKDFKGYCSEAVGEGPLAWELREDNRLVERFEEAKRYWGGWRGDFWPSLQKSQMASYEAALGPHSKYFGIDNKRWPPKALLTIPRDDAIVLVTVGLSARPQPNVELASEEPSKLARIELGAVVPRDWPEEHLKRLAVYLSGQSGYPWQAFTWFGHGHTMPCGVWRDPELACALLSNEHPAVPKVPLEPVLGDPVNLLWYLPISEAERNRATEEGAAALLQALPKDRWSRLGSDG
jgi:Suppressor of fused protein (SUFU)